MDTFFEQIVKMRKTAKDYFALIGIWLLALILSFIVFLFIGTVFMFAAIITVLLFYLAYLLSKRFFIEYEYIVTNTSLDIDKIIAKSSRKRVMSIEIPEIQSVEKYNPAAAVPNGVEKTVIACNKNDAGAFCLLATKSGTKKQFLVFAPNDRIKEGIVKSLPKFIANSAFK